MSGAWDQGEMMERAAEDAAWLAESADIEAERDRYREALERIVRICGDAYRPEHNALRIARDALAAFAPDRSGASAASGDPVARETTPPTPASEQARKTP